jgi:Ca2+-binding EF-hand superfamily protein
VIKRAYEEKGSQGLMDKSRGPKINSKRTKEMEKQIIRHRFLDPEASSQVITQRLQQAGNNISQRSVERTINEYGLQKKGYIKQLKKMRNRK